MPKRNMDNKNAWFKNVAFGYVSITGNWEQQKHFCHVVMVMKRKNQLDVEKTAL